MNKKLKSVKWLSVAALKTVRKNGIFHFISRSDLTDFVCVFRLLLPSVCLFITQ